MPDTAIKSQMFLANAFEDKKIVDFLDLSVQAHVFYDLILLKMWQYLRENWAKYERQMDFPLNEVKIKAVSDIIDSYIGKYSLEDKENIYMDGDSVKENVLSDILSRISAEVAAISSNNEV